MQTIEFQNEDTRSVSGTNDKGRHWSMTKQDAVLHGAGPVPVWIEINLDDGAAPYKPGHYEALTPLAPRQFRAGEACRLEASRNLSLVLIKQPAASKAA